MAETTSSITDTVEGLGEVEDLPAFFDRMPVAFYRTDLAGRLVMANRALARLLGYESVSHLEEAMGTVSGLYVDPGQRRRWLERIREEGVILDFDVELRRRDGSSVWVRDSARLIEDESGGIRYYEGALIEVSDKVRAEREREAFVAGISHELRNPLAAMLGLSTELADRYESFGDEERRDIAVMIARQADDASWIIEDLLVAHRGDLGELNIAVEPLDVVAEVNRVLEVVERSIPVMVEDPAPRVLADPRRLRQILRNLVSNAERYGGDEIRVVVRVPAGLVEIRVEDSGEPIPPPEVERIFLPYERGSGRDHPKSVGLGLSVARRLARLMQGDLLYRHHAGWSSFALSLPSA